MGSGWKTSSDTDVRRHRAASVAGTRPPPRASLTTVKNAADCGTRELKVRRSRRGRPRAGESARGPCGRGPGRPVHRGARPSTLASARQMPVAVVVMTRMFLVTASVPWGPESSELRNTETKDVSSTANGYVWKSVPSEHKIEILFSYVERSRNRPHRKISSSKK